MASSFAIAITALALTGLPGPMHFDLCRIKPCAATRSGRRPRDAR